MTAKTTVSIQFRINPDEYYIYLELKKKGISQSKIFLKGLEEMSKIHLEK